MREPVDFASGQLDLAQHVLAVDVAIREILAEQLERAAQRRQRRAQLVRRRRDERPPRALLAVERGLHRRQRAGEVADLVAALVARRPRARALPRDAQRRGAQALQARGERPDEREPEQERDDEADDRRADEGGADLGHDGGDVVGRVADGEHPVVAARLGVERQQRRDPGVAVARRARHRLVRRQDAEDVPRAVGARAGVVGVRVDRRRRVGEDHARPRAAVQRERQLEDLAVELAAALAQRVVELRPRRDDRGAQALLGLALQAVLQRGQEGQGGRPERHGRRRDERQQQP